MTDERLYEELKPKTQKFAPGQILATPGVLKALEDANESALPYLQAHLSGEWGILDEEDKQANDDALKFGDRLLSAYKLKDRTKIWIITEADRSATTLLLPDEY